MTVLAVICTAALPACAPQTAPATTAAERASVACPTRSDALVGVRNVEPSIRAEIRYATADNFVGAPLPGYEVPRALLRPDAARALGRVQQRLRRQGLGLKVWDAYRPVRATLAMVEWAERTGNEWMLDQGYVARRSGHNLGGTVDLTLVDLETGEELDMGTAYDTFSEAAHTENATGAVRENRMRLVEAMVAEGFENYPKEWWHFSYSGDYEPLDVPLACFTGPGASASTGG